MRPRAADRPGERTFDQLLKQKSVVGAEVDTLGILNNLGVLAELQETANGLLGAVGAEVDRAGNLDIELLEQVTGGKNNNN